MWIGACLDAGWAEERVRELPARLGLDQVSVEIERRSHGGLTGMGIRVVPEEGHVHRGLSDVLQILEQADLTPGVRERSAAVFRALARAEARVHGVGVDAVHFHEVGAHDAIVDVVGSVQALEDLGVVALTADPVPLNQGEVRAAHGILPVPAPATSLLLEGWPVVPGRGAGEWITPTGAALLRTLAEPGSGVGALAVEKVGFGAGSRTHPERPNLVRLWIGTEIAPVPDGSGLELGIVSVLETQVDDMTGEELGHLADVLRAGPALDVTFEPVHMKKGRPGWRLTLLCRPEHAIGFATKILSESRTLGVRCREERRWERPRRIETRITPWGPIRVKLSSGPEGTRAAFEFEDLVRLGHEQAIPPAEVERRLAAWLSETPPLNGPDSPV